jgi:hypothetical protein
VPQQHCFNHGDFESVQMQTSAQDIETSGADEREVAAAIIVRKLLDLFEDSPEVALGIAGLLFKGNMRLLATKSIVPLLQAIDKIGINEAWASAVRLGLFRHVDRPILPNMRLDLNQFSQRDCKINFRFDQDEIRFIVTRLPFPNMLIHPGYGDRMYLVEAFCLLLRRMVYPNRWQELEKEFSRWESTLSRMFQYLMHLILERVMRGVLLYPVDMDCLIRYCAAFARKGVPECLRIVAVLDAKKHNSCRPTHHQRTQFKRKKGHGFQYQTLESPDGLVMHCWYAEDGSRGDPYLLWASKLQPFWRAHFFLRFFRMLADSAYGNNDIIIALFKRRRGEPVLPILRRTFNSLLSPIRTEVEWGYEKIVRDWAMIDFRKKIQIEKCNVEALFHLAVWLTNVKTCARRGNQISKWFNCEPPTLDEYLSKTLMLDHHG